MRSPELEALVRAWFEAASTGSTALIERHVAIESEARLIGSDPGEWFVGGAAVAEFLRGEVHGAAGNVSFVPSDTEAFSVGDVGWATTKLTVSMPDGRRVQPRWSAVFRREEGTWRIVQLHASIAVPNEQIGWVYPEAAPQGR
ncbi:MAG: nuclear transport factor 2 family protein [Vicinamibacterales bacterium]